MKIFFGGMVGQEKNLLRGFSVDDEDETVRLLKRSDWNIVYKAFIDLVFNGQPKEDFLDIPAIIEQHNWTVDEFNEHHRKISSPLDLTGL
jgi:histone acetyltransferase (RNA polymerase elongator complex component)